MRHPLLLAILALAVPAGITLETVVLFWTYPLSSLVAVLVGVAFAAMLAGRPDRVIAWCAAPAAVWMVWLLLSPLSSLGYGPALSRFIALNLAVFLVTLVAVRWQQRKSVARTG